MAVLESRHRCADCRVAGGSGRAVLPEERLAIWAGFDVGVAGVRSAHRPLLAGRLVHG
jgi:hypothetical protein